VESLLPLEVGVRITVAPSNLRATGTVAHRERRGEHRARCAVVRDGLPSENPSVTDRL